MSSAALEDEGVFHEFGLGAQVFGVEGVCFDMAIDGIGDGGCDVDGAGGEVHGWDGLINVDAGGDGDDGPEEGRSPPVAAEDDGEL